jgi:hypothetical protein
MFCEKRFVLWWVFQRKMGVIKSLSVRRFCSFSWRKQNIEVEKYEWQNIRYKVDPATTRKWRRGFRDFCALSYQISGQLRFIKAKDWLWQSCAWCFRKFMQTRHMLLSRLRSLEGLIFFSVRMNGISTIKDVIIR